MLLCGEITPADISAFQCKRQKVGASTREINMECAVLRMVLRKHRLWHLLAADFRPLRERGDTGKALPPEEVQSMLTVA